MVDVLSIFRKRVRDLEFAEDGRKLMVWTIFCGYLNVSGRGSYHEEQGLSYLEAHPKANAGNHETTNSCKDRYKCW